MTEKNPHTSRSNRYPEESPEHRQPGPGLLADRSLGGIFIHLFGLGGTFLVPWIVYAISDHEYTKANARNALNWQAFFLGIFLALLAGSLGLAAVAELVPDIGATGLAILAVISLNGAFLLIPVNFVLVLIATGKAIFGEPWRYPLTPDIVGWVQSGHSVEHSWAVGILGYVLFVPLAAAVSVLTIQGPLPFVAGFVAILAWILASVGAAVAVYRDSKEIDTDGWRLHWLPYIGVPAALGVLAATVREATIGSENPPGDAAWVSVIALWIAVSIYLFVRHRYVNRT